MLPEKNMTWPPPSFERPLDNMAEWSAWYSGDPEQLAIFYEAASRARAKVRPSQLETGLRGRVARWWWGTPAPANEPDAKLHVPLAADLCGTSADLLFSEAVKLKGEDQSLQEFFDGLQEDGLDAKLAETAEVAAALGGGYLRTVWNRSLSPRPWTDTVHADMALPEFRWGRLAAVTFWQLLPGGDNRVWRLLERHEPGSIVYTLWQGREDNLGQQMALEDHPDTEPLAKLVGEDGSQPTGTDRLTATYVPNMLPNRRDRGSKQGRSDLQGVESWLDALDEAYSSWWRDIRHAKSRLHVPAQYLQTDGPGSPALANIDRELYVPLDGVLPSKDNLLIDAQQFKIRFAEHQATCDSWRDSIIEAAGYSTQSLSGGGEAVTAAEVRAHNRRSYMTRGKKIRYWKAALRDHLQTQVEVARANLPDKPTPGDFTVTFEDGVQETLLELAQTAQAMRTAQAASVDTVVRLTHPEWDDDQVSGEVTAIIGEQDAAAEPLPVPDDAGF